MPRGHEAQGKYAQQIGRAFEKSIANMLDVMLQLQVVEHWVHNEVRYERKGKDFFPVAAAGADFTGMLRGGLTFAIEAKTEEDNRFGKRRVSEMQRLHLDAVARGGGLALLALRLRLPDDRWLDYLAPWAAIPWDHKRSELGTLGLAELTPWPMKRPALEPYLRRCRLSRAIHLRLGPGVREWSKCLCDGEPA